MSPVPKKSRLEKAEESPKASESNPNSGLIRFEVDKVSTLDEVGRDSSEVKVGGVPWRAKVCKKEEEGKDCLTIYLVGCENKLKLWSIDVKAELTLLNENSSKDKTKIVSGTYNRDNSICGSSILLWEELIDEEKGFIKDDKVTIEIRSSILNVNMHPQPKTSEDSAIESDNPNSGVIRFDVDKVSRLIENGRYSPVIEVGGVPWRVLVCKKPVGLCAFLCSIYHKSKEWNIDVNFDCILVNSDSSENIAYENSCRTMSHQYHERGFSFLAWDKLMDEEKGFIKDDQITVEVRFTILKMEGIWIKPHYNSPSSGSNCTDIAVMVEGKPVIVDKLSLIRYPLMNTGNNSKSNFESGVLRFVVDNVSTLNSKGRFSPEAEVGGVPWKAKLAKLKKGKVDYLAVDLYSINYQSKQWSMEVNFKCTLVNSDSSKNITRSGGSVILRCDEHDYGFWLLSWKDLMNEEKGFIKDDEITVELHFSILNMKGIWIKPNFISSSHSDSILIDGPITVKKHSLFHSDPNNSEESFSGFINFEISPADITRKIINSPAIEVHGIPLSVGVTKHRDPSSLAVYICPLNIESNIWSFDVSAEIVLINSNENQSIKKRLRKKRHNYETGRRGYATFPPWDDLINEEKGFVKDGKITVEAQFTISNIVGIRRIVPIDFTDPNDPRHDLTLLIEGKKVYVGKQILAFHSPVFNAMFYGNHIEKNKKEIELKEINHKVFIKMLNLIYPSYQKINDDNAEPLLKMADYFQINTVIDQVVQFLINSTKLNVLAKLKLSDQYRLVKLQDYCLDSFKTVNEISDLHSNEGYKMLSAFAKSALMDKTMKLRSAE